LSRHDNCIIVATAISIETFSLFMLSMLANGPELSCGADNYTNVLPELRSRIGGALLLQIHFFARSEKPLQLQPSA
jgi:hypothetical protein